MSKKTRPPSEDGEEPPSEWWYKTSFRQGKIRRIKLKIEKKRHRQFPIAGDNNAGTKHRRKKLEGMLQNKD